MFPMSLKKSPSGSSDVPPKSPISSGDATAKLSQWDHPILKAAALAISAFGLGISSLVFLDGRIAGKVEEAVKKQSLLVGPQGEIGPQGPEGSPGPSISVGVVVAWPLEKAIPSNWALCDGSQKPREGRFSALNKILEVAGYPYGAGDGSTTFTLPDFRGYFLRGLDAEGTRDSEKGRTAGSRQDWATAMPKKPFLINNAGAHHHKYTTNSDGDPATSNRAEVGGGGDDDSANTAEAGLHNHTISGGDLETRPLNVAVNWIIYVGD